MIARFGSRTQVDLTDRLFGSTRPEASLLLLCHLDHAQNLRRRASQLSTARRWQRWNSSSDTRGFTDGSSEWLYDGPARWVNLTLFFTNIGSRCNIFLLNFLFALNIGRLTLSESLTFDVDRWCLDGPRSHKTRYVWLVFQAVLASEAHIVVELRLMMVKVEGHLKELAITIIPAVLAARQD